MSQTAINRWCQWASQLQPQDIPASTKKHALWAFCNWAALIKQAQSHPLTQMLSTQTRTHHAWQCHSVTEGAGDPAWIAWIHAAAAHVEDYDDTHYATIIHPSAPIISALAAIADARNLSGAQLERGIILGFDLALRLGIAVYPSHYDRGFHITATCGAIGAAVGIGCMLGYTAEDLEALIAIVTCHVSGSKGAFGSMGKAYQVGKAAHDAVIAHELFEQGLDYRHTRLGDPLGFQALYADQFNPAALSDKLGQHFFINDNAIKPFACGVVSHPAMSAALRIDQSQLQNIQGISIQAHPRVLELMGNPNPQTGLEAKFSVYHAVAAVSLYGIAGPQQFSDASVHEQTLVQLRQKIVVESNDAIRIDEAELHITYHNKDAEFIHIPHAISSVNNPMTDALLDRKWGDLLGSTEALSALRSMGADILRAAAAQNQIRDLWKMQHALTS